MNEQKRPSTDSDGYIARAHQALTDAIGSRQVYGFSVDTVPVPALGVQFEDIKISLFLS